MESIKEKVPKKITCIAVDPIGNQVLVVQDCSVLSFSFPNLTYEMNVMRAQMTVNHVSYNRDGSLIAVASKYAEIAEIFFDCLIVKR